MSTPNPRGKTKRSQGYHWGAERAFCSHCNKRRKVCWFSNDLSKQELYRPWLKSYFKDYQPICWGCYQWARLKLLK